MSLYSGFCTLFFTFFTPPPTGPFHHSFGHRQIWCTWRPVKVSLNRVSTPSLPFSLSCPSIFGTRHTSGLKGWGIPVSSICKIGYRSKSSFSENDRWLISSRLGAWRVPGPKAAEPGCMTSKPKYFRLILPKIVCRLVSGMSEYSDLHLQRPAILRLVLKISALCNTSVEKQCVTFDSVTSICGCVAVG